MRSCAGPRGGLDFDLIALGVVKDKSAYADLVIEEQVQEIVQCLFAAIGVTCVKACVINAQECRPHREVKVGLEPRPTTVFQRVNVCSRESFAQSGAPCTGYHLSM